MAFFPGRVASITIAATTRPYENFSLGFHTDAVPTNNFTGGGYNTNEAGMRGCKATFKGPYDGAEGVADGDLLSIIFATGGGGPSFTITERITDANITTSTGAVAEIEYVGESSGSFTVVL